MKRNILYTALAALAMFALIIIILVTSIQIAIYGDSEYHFYQKEYVKYTVAEALDMKISDLMEVTEHMMARKRNSLWKFRWKVKCRISSTDRTGNIWQMYRYSFIKEESYGDLPQQ